MARIGRIDLSQGEGGSTELVRRGVKPRTLERVYHGSLVIFALAGLPALVIDDAALMAIGMILVGMMPMILGLVVASNEVTYGGLLLLLRDRMVVRPERPEPKGYRDARPQPELVVDGKCFPLEGLREVVVGHIEIHGRYGTTHMYPIYAVLTDKVVEVATHNTPAPSSGVARALADAAGVGYSSRETGQVMGGGGIALMVVFLLLEVGVLVGAMIPHMQHQTLLMQIALPAAVSGAIMLLNLLFLWLGASTLRRSVDDKVRAIFGVA